MQTIPTTLKAFDPTAVCSVPAPAVNLVGMEEDSPLLRIGDTGIKWIFEEYEAGLACAPRQTPGSTVVLYPDACDRAETVETLAVSDAAAAATGRAAAAAALAPVDRGAGDALQGRPFWPKPRPSRTERGEMLLGVEGAASSDSQRLVMACTSSFASADTSWIRCFIARFIDAAVAS